MGKKRSRKPLKMNNKSFYKTVDLFGNEQIHFINKKVPTTKNLFSDYEGFVDKFVAKKTTDDCFTPPALMDIIIEYVNEKHPLKGMQIIRPFFNGGDFENVDYTPNSIVIDNPPFSILTKICRFYIEKGVKFFLFAPHLTLFTSDIDMTYIVTSSDITYENGAKVRTSFVSNLFGDVKILGDADLHKRIKTYHVNQKVNLPKYKYPANVLTVSKIAYFVEKWISLSIDKKDLKFCRALDSQKKHGKSLFGSGFLCSDRASIANATAIAIATADNTIEWELSEREKAIINML